MQPEQMREFRIAEFLGLISVVLGGAGLSRAGGSGDVQQAVVRIVMINGRGSNEFMFHKHRWRNRAIVQDVETDSYQICTIALREKCNRTNQAGVGLAQLGTSLGSGVLAHDGAGLGAAGFLKRAQRTNGTYVVDSSDNHSAGARSANMFAHHFETRA